VTERHTAYICLMQAIDLNHNQPIPETELILRADGSLYHLGVLPHQVASKIIIVGDPERVPTISELFDEVECRIHNREFVVHTGSYKGKRLTIVSSGIGVDNIDIVINELDAAVNVDLTTRLPKKELTSLEIVRIGTSGSIRPEIPVGSFVASVKAFALDGVPYSYQMQLSDDEAGLIQHLKSEIPYLKDNHSLYAVDGSQELLNRIAFDMVQGITATQNGFYGPQGRSVRLQSKVEPLLKSYENIVWKGNKVTNFEMECAGIYALSSLLGHRALTVCAILANRATKEFHKNPSTSVETLIRTVLERF
jgi:uridine phosphorylase